MPEAVVRTEGVLDEEAVARADRLAGEAVRAFLSGGAGPRAVVVSAPAGAGKSHLVARAVGRARAAGLRVAVAAPTNEQAFGLVRAIAAQPAGRRPGEAVCFVPARDVSLPPALHALPGVCEVSVAEAGRADLVVGTLSKLGDAYTRGTLGGFDALLLDESYQADSARYFAAAGLAPLHLLVGDGGQISPFTTIDDPARWRGLPEDPLQTAVGVLLRNHPATSRFGLPITRRLDGRAAAVARLFYPALPFDPAVRSGVRRLRLGPASSGRLSSADRALEVAARSGWAHLQLPRAPVVRADPGTVGLVAALLRRLFGRGPQVRCERAGRWADLRPEGVAVGVAHNDQKDHLRAALAEQGLGGVVVETANRLQGLEFEVVVVWHPLAGLAEPDGFHLDPGRLCVLLTRHRQACLVVGRAGDEAVLDDRLPPSTPAYLGHDADPVLDGWEIHRQVFAALEPFRVAV